ncbi:allophanate hydrolase [Paenibacillus sp. DCT19]|uniref:allophanate hydrolase n=1 Tax=Paenibacillus sp. DCT19 TaxID=2211212 RepID=UPI000FE265B5|nr:allophanate hydrolase [Paenibacillus sp. DCT19]
MTRQSVPEQLTVDNLQKAYRHRHFTPQHVIEAIIYRAEHTQEKNIWILPPSLTQIQPYLDQLEQMNPEDCPLWGIPFAIKDNIEVASWPVTAACPEFAYVPDRHATVVERLIAAGAIPVGKCNLDQFATGLVGTRSPYGDTHNALRSELISGGSSSGSAVAVASGQAAFALGTDTAGSGRVPAALNHLIGYKPAVGAWPSTGVIPACRSIDCVTVFTHQLVDAQRVDDVVRGLEQEDPYSIHRPLKRGQLPKVFLLPDHPLEFYGPYATAYEEAWNRKKQAIAASGVAVKEVDITLLQEAAALLYEGPLVAERWSDLDEFVETHEAAIFPVTKTVLSSGKKETFTASALFKAQHRLAAIRRHAAMVLEDAVLVLPTCGGTWTREQVMANPIETNSKMGLYTNHCNLLDLSAIAVPAGWAEEGVPFGVTLFTRPDEEANLIPASELLIQQEDVITVAVCGLHMRGMPLEPQMTGLGAVFREETSTAPVYEMYKLPTIPAKPGLVRVSNGGSSILVELWDMPRASFGSFTASIPAPLGIGKVQLIDGRTVSGFVCEAYAGEGAENISPSGGWRRWSEVAVES